VKLFQDRNSIVRCIIIFIVVSIFGISFQQAHATHIVGGEMNYTYLGNDSFYVKIKVYRDSLNAVPYFDEPLEFHVYNVDNQYVNTYFIPLPPVNLVVPQIDDSCFVEPPNVIVDYVIYEDTLFIPGVQPGWKFSYMRCCRNNSILNIESVDYQTGQTVPGEFTGALYPANLPLSTLENSNPEFITLPPVAICADKQLIYDHSAIDLDGDSLVYRLCTPFTGGTANDPLGNAQAQLPPFQEVLFIPPYSLTNVMGGTPLAIDSETGLLTAVPNTLGRFVISVCVDEYRNGSFLEEHRRDFQFNVVDCSKVFDADFEALNIPKVDTLDPFNILLCDTTLSKQFQNLIVSPTTVLWDFGDGGTSTEQHPIHVFPDTGAYLVTLIAGPGEQCADTIQKTIYVQQHIIGADFTYEADPCFQNETQFTFEDASNANLPIVSWEWVFSQDSSVFNSSATYGYSEAGDFNVGLYIFSEGGCCSRMDKTVNVQLLPPFSLRDTVIICDADSVKLPLLIEGQHAFSWSPPENMDNPNLQQPTVITDITQQYIVEISTPNPYGGGACLRKDTTVVVVNYPPPFIEANATPTVLATAGEVELLATQNDTYEYSWSPSAVLDNPLIFNPIANIEISTLFEVIVKDSNGCINSDTALVIILDTECEPASVFIPNAFSPNGDGLNDVFRPKGAIIESMLLVVYDRWGNEVYKGTDFINGWDGRVDGELLSGDAYGYILSVGCIGGEAFEVKGNVTLVR
jgi:gliding motility-associated-like protein